MGELSSDSFTVLSGPPLGIHLDRVRQPFHHCRVILKIQTLLGSQNLCLIDLRHVRVVLSLVVVVPSSHIKAHSDLGWLWNTFLCSIRVFLGTFRQNLALSKSCRLSQRV